jgi:dTDP-4-dehydrorhamnose reductase
VKVAVIGASGQLGMDVSIEFERVGAEVARLDHSEIEISSLESTRQKLGEIHPDCVVNTAAMHHVENCELQPERAYAVNAIGAKNLAAVINELNAVLMHISTDYVFDGNKCEPYVEMDHPLPLNVYGNTKMAGESFICAAAKKYFILRTSALYGIHPCRAKGGRNFVELMLKLAGERDELRVVADEKVSPTCTAELAKQIVRLSRTDAFGLYHATAEGSCSWYEFAETIFKFTGTKISLKVAAANEFPAKVPRPKYSVLENHNLKKLGLNSFQSWEDGLKAYLQAKQRIGQSKAIATSCD